MKYDFKLNIKKSMEHHGTVCWLRGKQIMEVVLKMNEFGVGVVGRGGKII